MTDSVASFFEFDAQDDALTSAANSDRSAKVAPPALPLEAQGDDSRKYFVRGMWAIIAFTSALLAIAAIAPIHKVAVTEGQILPEGSVMAVSNLEGGIVAEILVSPGQAVKEGESLVRLRAGGAASDFGQLDAQRAGLALSQMRLRALLDGTTPNFGSIATDPARIAEETRTFTTERSALEAVAQTHEAHTNQLRSEIVVLERELEGARTQLGIVTERHEMFARLLESGYATRASAIEAELEVTETQTRLERLTSQIASARSSVAQSNSELAQALSERRRGWSSELSRVTAQLESAEAGIDKLQERLADLDLRAPAAGKVQRITPKAVGAVIRPGEPVVEIVSTESELLAEVRIDPKEVGEVHVGADAKVIITAFDSEVYGDVTGVVRRISPMTFSEDGSGSFYVATLALSRTQLEARGQTFDLLPGMTVRAEIVTGERTLLQHLFKPIDRALQRAFQQGY
ncbi:HlyD family type I secretion periplasmic adaptor subunit [Hyphomonas sp.]|jgi:adhesin transport system membrane fusion protein|uniref:HlyD family type I secretion periplasmic adaptor subunit n=1 Tax=Hyphomonas sp. TaxID=87 RepID=UPI0025BDAA4B|nr:HlyD family type I secretion periplasmic adaptor subunit [Hyphomonas sp.]